MVPVLGIFIIFILFVLDKEYLDFVQVTSIGTALCLVGFFLTGKISSKELSRVRDEAIINEIMRLQKYPAASRDDVCLRLPPNSDINPQMERISNKILQL